MRVPRTVARAIVVALALVGATAVQARAYDALLYELTENMKLRGGDVKRQATAALGGTVNAGTSICPAAVFGTTPCAMHATASDNLDLATGTGPATGRFAVVIQGDNPVDGAELVVLEGTLVGTVDLSPVLGLVGGTPIPLGSIAGRWQATGTPGGPLADVTVGGTFQGTFRLPYVAEDGRISYLIDGTAHPVAENEKALGVPTVRLELEFN
jgi:hypothetical protein